MAAVPGGGDRRCRRPIGDPGPVPSPSGLSSCSPLPQRASPGARRVGGGDSGVRVLHVVSSPRFAGVERYITNVTPELAARGCEVTVAGGRTEAMRSLLGT